MPLLRIPEPFDHADFLYEVKWQDLEGIVAKWKDGRYQAGTGSTSWLKIKNRAYSQVEGRHDLFAARHGARGRAAAPRLQLASPS
jgi:ATP-dependent DNA ligase